MQQDGGLSKPPCCTGTQGLGEPQRHSRNRGSPVWGGGSVTPDAAWGPASPPAPQDRAAGGGWRKGEPCRERRSLGERRRGWRGPVPDPALGEARRAPAGSAAPRDVTAAGPAARGGPGHHPHPPAAPIRRKGRVLGANGHVPGGGGDGGSRQAGQPGSLLARPTHVPASSHTCPCLVPAFPGSGCGRPCQPERNTPGSEPPWHPTPLPMPGPLAGGRWDGTEPRVAGGGCAPWQRAPWQSHPAPREHPRSDASGGSRHVPGPPSKPASRGDAARDAFSLPRRDSPG